MIPSTFNQAAICFAGISGESAIHELDIAPIKGGLINHSFIVQVPHAPNFLLQQINKNVFKDPQAVQENYLNIWHQNQQMRLPKPIFDREQSSLYVDVNGQYWRAFEFIENTSSPTVATTTNQVYATARTFGAFTAAFINFDTDKLKITIPDFHNLSLRFEQFQSALSTASEELKLKAGTSLELLSSRSAYKDFYNTVVTDPANYRKRVMHHDAKIANVLFDKTTGAVVCPVDFDTVRPGYFFSDLGDMIRSMACNHAENYRGAESIHVQPEYYEAIIDGYLSVMKEHLTPSEMEHIHYSGLIMIYMQALRFMSDFLQNDIYYHTEYPSQNLDRANNQLSLLVSLETFLKKTPAQKVFAY